MLKRLKISVSGSIFFLRLSRFKNFSKKKGAANKVDATQAGTNSNEKNAASIDHVLPFIIQADLQDETAPFIYNPYGNGKLLKKMTDDLACTFIVTTIANEPVIIDKAFLTVNNISPEEVAAKAEQNLLKLYQQQRQIVKKEMGSNSTLYSIVLNNRNEPSAMFAKNIFTLLSAQHQDHLLVSVPKYNEIHYCTLKSNAVPDLFDLTISTWKNAGTAALSPNVYLFHNESWIIFNEGPEQVLDYCVAHNLITLNFNL